jgi:hypothetical protein
MVFRRIHKIVTSFPQQNDRLYRRKSLQMNNTWQRKHSYFVIGVIQLWKKVPMLYMIYGFFAILQVFAFLYSTKLLLNFQFRVLMGLGKGLYFATNLCSTAHLPSQNKFIIRISCSVCSIGILVHCLHCLWTMRGRNRQLGVLRFCQNQVANGQSGRTLADVC